MSHAERCPVCYGQGKLPLGDSKTTTTITAPIEKICHGCNGSGWIVVSDDQTYNIKNPWVIEE